MVFWSLLGHVAKRTVSMLRSIMFLIKYMVIVLIVVREEYWKTTVVQRIQTPCPIMRGSRKQSPYQGRQTCTAPKWPSARPASPPPPQLLRRPVITTRRNQNVLPILWRLAKKIQIPFDFGNGSQETPPQVLVSSLATATSSYSWIRDLLPCLDSPVNKLGFRNT